MNVWTKLIPIVVSSLTALAAMFSGPLQNAVSANPAIAAVLGGIVAIISSLMPSPLKK